MCVQSIYLTIFSQMWQMDIDRKSNLENKCRYCSLHTSSSFNSGEIVRFWKRPSLFYLLVSQVTFGENKSVSRGGEEPQKSAPMKSQLGIFFLLWPPKTCWERDSCGDFFQWQTTVITAKLVRVLMISVPLIAWKPDALRSCYITASSLKQRISSKWSNWHHKFHHGSELGEKNKLTM